MHVKKMKARKARKKMKTRKPCKKQKHVRHVKKCRHVKYTHIYFAYSTVTNNAIPVFYNSFECFQIFAGLYVRRERVPNFGSKISYALITKANWINFRNIKIKSILTTNRSISLT